MILSASDGIRVFASSAFSQHSEPRSMSAGPPPRILLLNGRTQLRALKLGQVLVCAEEALYSLDILLLRESGEMVEVGEGLVKHSSR